MVRVCSFLGCDIRQRGCKDERRKCDKRVGVINIDFFDNKHALNATIQRSIGVGCKY